MVRFSEFLGMGYFGDERQSVIAPIFDSRHNAEKGWKRVAEGRETFHAVFVEHDSKYEFIAYPLEMDDSAINYVLYRSFSSLGSLHKFRETRGARTFIKFGWHDLTKPEKFDVMATYALVDGVEFIVPSNVRQGSLIDRIRKNEL
jgi:hypothetical protein